MKKLVETDGALRRKVKDAHKLMVDQAIETAVSGGVPLKARLMEVCVTQPGDDDLEGVKRALNILIDEDIIRPGDKAFSGVIESRR
jgi:hypothetical protein